MPVGEACALLSPESVLGLCNNNFKVGELCGVSSGKSRSQRMVILGVVSPSGGPVGASTGNLQCQHHSRSNSVVQNRTLEIPCLPTINASDLPSTFRARREATGMPLEEALMWSARPDGLEL